MSRVGGGFNVKGSVQRDVTGVESRLKIFALKSKTYYRKGFSLEFKGKLSLEEQKTCFSFLTTTLLNLLIEFTKSYSTLNLAEP
jgi:hypothetical protein